MSVLHRRILLNIFTRQYSSKPKQGAVKFAKVTYYPRFPDEQDAEFTPTKLFRVQRIKPLKGNPYWEKDILKHLGLDKKLNDVAIVKNIPENNARLWKVKHLIKVTPVKFPYGEPTEQDINNTYLKENGDCIVHQSIDVGPKRLKDAEEFENSRVKLDPETLRKDSRLKWLNPW